MAYVSTTKLEHALKYATQQQGGKVYEFQVPNRELIRWTDQMRVQEFRDVLHGTSGTGLELRFSPSVAHELNKYHLQIP